MGKSFSPAAVSLNQLDSTLTSIMREKALPKYKKIFCFKIYLFPKYQSICLGFLPFQKEVDFFQILHWNVCRL